MRLTSAAGQAASCDKNGSVSRGPLSFESFMSGEVPECRRFTFLSLFSGAGVGDFGLVKAGGQCLAACEVDPHRQSVHSHNIGAPIWGDITTHREEIISEFVSQQVDILVATPPCQGFSTANGGRGKRTAHSTNDSRNNLFFEALEVASAISPKIVIFENVPNFLERVVVSRDGKVGRIREFLSQSLDNYQAHMQVECLSKAGVPQRRKRALCIFVRRDLIKDQSRWQASLNMDKWGGELVGSPRTVKDALQGLPPLDGRNSAGLSEDPGDPMHCVPEYQDRHYLWISSIPTDSGKSAWDNACPHCKDANTPWGEVHCRACGALNFTRPHVVGEDGVRPIRGFRTSYRRVRPDELAPTITTSSGHFSSDLKLHYAQNRVFSPRECAILQTIPNTFEWPEGQVFKKRYLIREMIGEAVPTLAMYRLGVTLAEFI